MQSLVGLHESPASPYMALFPGLELNSSRTFPPSAVSVRKALDFPHNKRCTGSKHKSLSRSLVPVCLAPPASPAL